jgi:hypothetical protein
VKDLLEGLTIEGMIQTGVDRSRVPDVFAPILEDVRREFDLARVPSAELHLYGSVATGQARFGESDVDLMAIDGSAAWAAKASSRLSLRYADVCRGVEIGTVPADVFSGPGDEAYGFRVFLRHYCVPISGPSRLRPTTPFPGDAKAARGFNGDIATHLASWRQSRPSARVIARKSLLAAAGVVSVRTRTWTTDRGTAAHAWARIDPARHGEIEELLAWATGGGAATPDQLTAALSPNGIVTAIVDRFASEIGLWDAPDGG